MLRSVSILNPQLLATLAGAGHTDLIVVADSGLPIPRGVELIDLSLLPGVPSFLQVVDAVRESLVFESVVLASETRDQALFGDLSQRLGGHQLHFVTHEEFKQRSARALAIVRTGEQTPYANIGFIASVPF